MEGLKLSHLISIIADDFGWNTSHERDRYQNASYDRIQVSKEGKKNRSIFYDGVMVFICQADACDHGHLHEISIHDPRFEEVVRSWFPFFEERDSTSQWYVQGTNVYWWGYHANSVAEMKRQIIFSRSSNER